MPERTTTRLTPSRLIQCGDSKRATAAFRWSDSPTPRKLAGAVVLATPRIKNQISWCEDCCAGVWCYEEAHFVPILLGDTFAPIYIFYFSNAVDVAIFQQVHKTEMRLALETNP